MSVAFGCVNNTIRLRSGRYFDFANPQADQICIEDIAGALSKECRFGNHCNEFYSVAEHSVAAAKLAEKDGHCREAVFACLMHDAAEAYTCDFPKPLKIMLPDFQRVEKAVEAAVAEAFGIDFERWGDVIKQYDMQLLIAERNALFTRDGVTWTGENQVKVIEYSPMCQFPLFAEEGFLRAFKYWSDT